MKINHKLKRGCFVFITDEYKANMNINLYHVKKRKPISISNIPKNKRRKGYLYFIKDFEIPKSKHWQTDYWIECQGWKDGKYWDVKEF